ncbi:UNVERIFIED_CONTAM: hypothetical protein Sradi_3137700 [Sesamum radiatum]|uniref:Uncharacterized protein n=1 Tax=Sesamum radiatum TaxID=300843 RepID=A0AAW2RDN5_SESRA
MKATPYGQSSHRIQQWPGCSNLPGARPHHYFGERDALLFIFWGSFNLVAYILQALLNVFERREPLRRDLLRN